MIYLQCSQRARFGADTATDTFLVHLQVCIDQLQRPFGTNRDAGAAVSTDLSVYGQPHSQWEE